MKLSGRKIWISLTTLWFAMQPGGWLFFSPVPVAATNGIEGSPLIANWWFKWSMTESEMKQLAQYDVLLIDVENQKYSPEKLLELRKLNPSIVLLAYISVADIRKDASELEDDTFRGKIGNRMGKYPSWILRDQNGKKVTWWPGNVIFNLTDVTPDSDDPKFNTVFPKLIAEEVYAAGLWDGVFIDNVWEGVSFTGAPVDFDQDGTKESKSEMNELWFDGVEKILKRIRKKTDDRWIITGNGGVGYVDLLDGVAFENFPVTSYGDWTPSLKQYFYVGDHADFPIINSNDNNGGNPENYQKFRFGLTSALLGEGYYSFDSGDETHHEIWWYDEYSVPLGKPVAGAYNTLNDADSTEIDYGLWRRDFENGIVLVNSTGTDRMVVLEDGYEKIRGLQDTKTNSGKVIGSVKINSEDGIILLSRIQKVTDAPFINGAVAKVFDDSGKELRNAFFTYDGSFAGGAKIIRLPDIGRIVVAGSTYVDVYDTANHRLSHFAPYGEQFTGGVRIAAGRLEGKKKPYRIVTGTESQGPQVRVFNLNGELVQAGCFPYPESFRGGVNVAVGDVTGDKDLEIVTAPGKGGGPQVLILNSQCETISSGFFAFDQSLRTGLSVAAGDLTGDGRAEIVVAPLSGGGPQVRVFNAQGNLLHAGFFAYNERDRSGVHLAVTDITGDGNSEIVVNSFSVFSSF